MVLKSLFDDFWHNHLIVLEDALFYDRKYTVIFIICKQKSYFLRFSRISQQWIWYFCSSGLWHRITEWWVFDFSIKHIGLIVNLVSHSIKQSHTSGLRFSGMLCRVSGWLVSDISRECIGLIFKVDFPRRMEIASSKIRPLLLTNNPMTRRHILVERKHSYFIISECISSSFSPICLCT
jgi:hypothetical protein